MEKNYLQLVGDEDANLTLVDALARGASAERIAEAIRSGICPSDRSFDRLLPYELRRVSGQHWTPLAVALRVSEWLNSVGVRTVIDVGSGAGKFCVAAALASRCSVIGIEHRRRFVEAAHTLAYLFGVGDRIQFIHGALNRCVIPTADAYYLYNPFGENLRGPDEHLGDDVELSPERYQRDIAFMRELFDQAPVGTFVIKYNGFGGRMPPSYKEVLVDREMPNMLRMWRKD